MKIVSIGGGPAGLYSAILLKKSDPSRDITVIERNGPNDTFGWGVVFSDETLQGLEEADAESFATITRSFALWDSIDVHVAGRVLRSGGHVFAGISRQRLLNILHDRCRELEVELRFNQEVEDPDAFSDADLVLACDGVNSRTRALHADHFRPTIRHGRAKFIWLGTTQTFEAFTFVFRENDHGLFQVHAYRYDEEHSTFIVETDEETWRRSGFDEKPVEQSVEECERLFAPELDGHRLLTNRSLWINFAEVKNETWHRGNLVLLGDAAHTAHFSIGSGTKLALEDAIALDRALAGHDDMDAALDAYEEDRRLDVAKTQRAATHSQAWFEHAARYRDLEPEQLAFSLMTRSKKLGHENLRLRDPGYVESVDRWFARSAGVEPGPGEPVPPPMFTPYRLRGMELVNRVVVSPMCMYCAQDGTIDDWHLVHLGSRAIGGAGLVMTEMTDVSREGRITPGCAGMYLPEHVAAWRRVTDFVHRWSPAKIGLQLAHAGRKGSTKLMWEGMDEPLPEGNWPILGPSPVAWAEENQVPREMTRQDMEQVRDDFVRSAGMAVEAGFDLLELHLAHGYLLATFLSPLTNLRTDEWGGSLENRMRFPLEVVEAVRAEWPDERPLSCRISATDWLPGGFTDDDSVVLSAALKESGVDVIDVSSGLTTPEAKPEIWGRMFQVPFSDRIRHEVGMPTMAVGNITTWDQVNTIVAAGRADLCVLARGHLRDPYFTLHAAEEQDWHDVAWPLQYGPAKPRPPEE